MCGSNYITHSVITHLFKEMVGVVVGYVVMYIYLLRVLPRLCE
nr:MAG TPA: hypothetical protein [Caudoviricetes sp.]